MKRYNRLIIQVLSLSFVIGITPNPSGLSAQSLDNTISNQDLNKENIKYPNGIPEHQNVGQQSVPFSHPSIETKTDPTVRIGPNVIIGPNVYIKGKPAPNPLLKDVLPANHPLLTKP